MSIPVSARLSFRSLTTSPTQTLASVTLSNRLVAAPTRPPAAVSSTPNARNLLWACPDAMTSFSRIGKISCPQYSISPDFPWKYLLCVTISSRRSRSLLYWLSSRTSSAALALPVAVLAASKASASLSSSSALLYRVIALFRFVLAICRDCLAGSSPTGMMEGRSFISSSIWSN